jgi:hypothetical protein
MFDRAIEMLANSIARGVPVRGIPRGKTLPIDIDAQLIREPDWRCISENELRLKTSSTRDFEPADFWSVTINWSVLDEFGRDRWPDMWPVLKPASPKEIKRAIKAVYDVADAAGEKPPNIREIIDPVKAWLKMKGYSASNRQIQNLAKPFKARRRPQGKTLRSE